MAARLILNTMQCLKDFVAPFDGCGSPSPLSGMFLSQLPGIEFANIDGIANADQVTWKGVWDDLQATTIDTFREDVIAEFGKRYMLKQITQTVDLGQNILPQALNAPVANVSNGIILETMVQGNMCIGSNMMGLYVQEIKFFWAGTNGTPSFTVIFQDADLLNIEYTVTVSNAVAGWNSVFVDKFFAARRLQILVSGNFDNYTKLDISNFMLDNFGGSSWGYGSNTNYLYFNWSGCGIQSRVNGITYNSTNNTLTRSMNTSGLSVIFSTKCSWDTVVCSNKRHFASSWQHCLAIELLNYRINTSRLNRWVTLDKKQAIDLQKLLVAKYRGGMSESGTPYIGKLQNAIESLRINDVDGCIRGNDYMMFTETRL